LRLKHIHLAGFKSFVDPVTIPAPARLTGVVGPNGCGKSNVIDAVRWVLGESKARELRGESMQDVIFNGSANRKPASRASVEMLFDNGEGRAAGQWSQYAEIAVKRVLTRQGESSYYINNVKVRRKDLYDLFLGTGLGGDAYAIIEQGMISRIIESKPEELRGYLEEAAGVSKYKERRKETEYRLRDTRENLARVEDIRIELARQLEKLAVQAEVARRYFALDAERTLKARLMALARRNDARLRQAELNRQMEAARTAIEERLAELRHLEAALEDERLAQFEATEALNRAQALFYGESGEVARIEQELRHLNDTRQRLGVELVGTRERRQRAEEEIVTTRAEILAQQDALTEAEAQAEILSERAREASVDLPEVEAAWRAAQAAVAEAQTGIGQCEQAVQLALSDQQHAGRRIDQLKAREMRLIQEQEGLAELDEPALARQRAELEEAEDRAARLAEYLEDARAGLPALEAGLRQARQVSEAASRELHRLEAELNALEGLQASARQAESEGAAWLRRVGLESVPRLWQCIRVESGWETAVEAALGEAMAAIAAESHPEWLAEEPPEARFELALPALPDTHPEFVLDREAEGVRPMFDLIHAEDVVVARFLADRLALAFAAEDLATALACRAELPPGGFFATREGHRVGRASLVFNAPEKGHHGLLARLRDIERLREAVEIAALRQDECGAAASEAETTLDAGRRQVESFQEQIRQIETRVHEMQMALLRDQEAARRVAQRLEQIETELDELYRQLDEETETWNIAAERQREAELELDEARAILDAARQARQTHDQAFQAKREQQRQVEREAQEAGFAVRALGSRLRELGERVERGERMLAELEAQEARLLAELERAQETPIHENLAQALQRRQEAENALAATRNALEGHNARLQQLDAERLKTERALEPLKERVQGMELKLQEARLLEQRFAEELGAVDETELAARAEAEGLGARGEAWFRSEIERLERAIAELGAVNMAALDELREAEARKNYLDAQAADLETAANTLEEAIRRIDAETRARLRTTYDSVDAEFRRLFTELFGGGEASLILTGEEILDAGLMVMAQPPGKKNSSIHLLSGGEKALTAISLVFAFFRLNPAPFCLLDEVDAPLDDSNTERLCRLVEKMSAETQFMFITHNRITMELAQHLIGITMPEPGVSRPVAVDVEDALRLAEAA